MACPCINKPLFIPLLSPLPPHHPKLRRQGFHGGGFGPPGISTVFATNWYRFCDVHFCAFSAFFLAFCLHSVQRGAFSSCISQRIFVLLERIFAHFKALCCILSASTLLCLGVHLLCIHDAPFLDQCLMCILLHSCILYSMTFLRILTHSERLLRILGCMGGCSGEAPRHARPGMTAGIYIFSA